MNGNAIRTQGGQRVLNLREVNDEAKQSVTALNEHLIHPLEHTGFPCANVCECEQESRSKGDRRTGRGRGGGSE
jgi:hypothetical protein